MKRAGKMSGNVCERCKIEFPTGEIDCNQKELMKKLIIKIRKQLSIQYIKEELRELAY